VRYLAEGHAETSTDAKNFFEDIRRPSIGVDCDEDRLQD